MAGRWGQSSECLVLSEGIDWAEKIRQCEGRLVKTDQAQGRPSGCLRQKEELTPAATKSSPHGVLLELLGDGGEFLRRGGGRGTTGLGTRQQEQ